MAKTYTLISTEMHCGRRASWSDSDWNGYIGNEAYGLRIGYYQNNYRATNILFDSTTLASLRNKTVTSITLTLTFKAGTLPTSSATGYPIGYKLNSTATTESNGAAWTRSNADSTAASTTVHVGYVTSGSSSTQSISTDTQKTYDLTGTSVPKYGYTIGTVQSNTGANITLGTSATLTVVTNETDYTLKLSYDANGGSGAPSQQSHTVTTTGTPSYTFTIPNTTPSRTGYTFKGWATSSTATTASKQPGDTITISSNTTLYAVWQIITYTVSYNKGSYGTGTNTSDTKTYGVNLTLRGALFTRTGYAQDGWSTTDGGSKAYALAGTYSNNASVTLYPYWKVTSSTISASNGTIGSTVAITITRASSAYTHTVSYAFGTATGTIGTGITTSVNWTPPMSLCSEIPAAGSGQCVLTCTTYQGTTLIGSSTKTITLSVPSSVKCTISSVSLADTVASVVSQFNAYVQTKSKLSVNVTTSTSNAYGATVTAYSISINGQVLTENGAVTTTLQTAGSNSYSVAITDTRGKTDTYSGTFSVIAYVAPGITADSERDSTTNTTINVSYTWSISPVNDLNTKSVRIRYRLPGDYWTTATTVTPTTYSGTWTYAITGTDANGSYEVQVSAIDYFSTASISNDVSSVGDRVLYYSASDMTIAKHMENPKDGKDHQAFHEVFHDGATLEGSSSLASSATLANQYGDLANTGLNHYNGNSSTTSLATSTWLSLASMTLEPGIWLLFANARFASNATGIRKMFLSTTQDSSSSSLGVIFNDFRNPVSGDYTYVSVNGTYAVTSNTTIYLNCWQSSGSSLATYGRLYAVRIC